MDENEKLLEQAHALIARYFNARKAFEDGGSWNDNVRESLHLCEKEIDDFLYENLKDLS